VNHRSRENLRAVRRELAARHIEHWVDQGGHLRIHFNIRGRRVVMPMSLTPSDRNAGKSTLRRLRRILDGREW
jgi:hypothetical protein